MILEANAEDFAALLDNRAPGGFTLTDTAIAPQAVLEMLADLAERVRATFSPAAWLIIDGQEIVGLCSVIRPPAHGAIDIGYGIAPGRQRRGIASRAVGDIVAWAQGAPEVVAITAETHRDNLPSQSVLARNGFRRVGERIDPEDGALICWRHDLIRVLRI